jgi:hypothetical protein
LIEARSVSEWQNTKKIQKIKKVFLSQKKTFFKKMLTDDTIAELTGVPLVEVQQQQQQLEAANDAADDAKRPQAKRWCFTSYESTPPTWNPEVMEYLIYQQEKCPNTEKLHWQGYCCFLKKIKLNKTPKTGVKLYLGEKTHVEIARGCNNDNVKYCSKKESAVPDTFRSFGDAPDEELKHKYKQLKEDLADLTKSKKEVLLNNFELSIQHQGNVLNMYNLMREPDKFRKVYNVCFFGGTGVGKTRWVWENFPTNEIYFKSKTEWWQLYDQQKVVVWDDFYGHETPANMLNFMDIYKLQLNVKGKEAWLHAEVNVFTSNVDPREWWSKALEGKQDVKDALLRRMPLNNMIRVEWRHIADENGILIDKKLAINSPGWIQNPHWQNLDEIPSWEELKPLLTPLEYGRRQRV